MGNKRLLKNNEKKMLRDKIVWRVFKKLCHIPGGLEDRVHAKKDLRRPSALTLVNLEVLCKEWMKDQVEL